MSKVALCLTAESLKENQNNLNQSLSWIDLAELRVDCLKNPQIEEIKNFLKDCPVEVILTCRRESDGGFFKKDQEESRQNLLDNLLELPFAYVDLEEDLPEEWSQKATKTGTKVIRSFHDFKGTPSDLKTRFEKLKQRGIAKAAVTLNRREDYESFLSLIDSDITSGHILLAMGAEGLFSRILCPQWGGFLTYSSPEKGLKAAPGQLSPRILKELYRFDSISPKTRVLGIIGKKLGHSKSPEIHNQWLESEKIDAVYIPFPIPGIEMVELLKKHLNLWGLSITIPYKVEIMSLADSCSDRVQSIGACNTLYLKKGQWMGENTDAPGFLKPLLDFLNCSDLLNRNVTLIGAGGAARGILYALTEAGAKVLILNRTQEKAEGLAEEFSQEWAPLSVESNEKINRFNEIIIQTTGVGMLPDLSGNPLDFYRFSGQELLYDIIYNPPETALMKQALRAGAKTLGGFSMLEEQAKMQFKLFTGEMDKGERP